MRTALPYDVLLDIFDQLDDDNQWLFLDCRRTCSLWRTAIDDSYSYAATKSIIFGTPLSLSPWTAREKLRFRDACLRDDFGAARWLQQTHGYDPVTIDELSLLRMLSENGHLRMLRWIVDVHGLDRGSDALVPFVSACAAGQLSTAQWLTRRFAIDPKDMREINEAALVRACGAGQLTVARWLADTARFTRTDMRRMENYPLRVTCMNGHFAVVRWLCNHFRLEKRDIEDGFPPAHRPLQLAKGNDHYFLAAWLENEFKAQNRFTTRDQSFVPKH